MIEDYLLEALENGSAVRTSDTKLTEHLVDSLKFLVPVWGGETVSKWVDEWLMKAKKQEVVFYADVNSSLAQWLPTILIMTYRKMLEDFRIELNNPGDKSHE